MFQLPWRPYQQTIFPPASPQETHLWGGGSLTPRNEGFLFFSVKLRLKQPPALLIFGPTVAPLLSVLFALTCLIFSWSLFALRSGEM